MTSRTFSRLAAEDWYSAPDDSTFLRTPPNTSNSQLRLKGSVKLFWVIGASATVEVLAGRLPERRDRCPEKPMVAWGNNPDCVIRAEARACSNWLRAISIV